MVTLPTPQVYGLIDSDTLELRYVGQTTRPLEARLREHNVPNRSNNLHLNNWLRATSVNIITLERGPADPNEAEIRWIREMREQGARLLNLTDGGDCPPNWLGKTHSAETRAKMTGIKRSAETKVRLSAALMGNQNTLGYRPSAAARAKMSAAQRGNKKALGCKRSAETRAKISTAHMGLKPTIKTRAKMSESAKRRWNTV